MIKPTDLLDQILTSREKNVDQVHIIFHTNKLSLHVKMLLNTKSKRIGKKMIEQENKTTLACYVVDDSNFSMSYVSDEESLVNAGVSIGGPLPDNPQ